jgi:hypothetical protein
MQKDGGYMSGAITASDPNAEGEDGPAFEVGMAGTNGFLPMADRAGSHGAELAVNVTLGPSDLRVALFVTRASDSEDLDSIGLDVDLAGVSTDYRTELREPGVAAGLCLAEEVGVRSGKLASAPTKLGSTMRTGATEVAGPHDGRICALHMTD